MKSDNSTEVARKQRDWTQLKRALGHIGLLIALTAYTVLGGQVFSKLEGPDEAARLGPLHDAAVARRRELLGALANLSASDPPAAARVERALAAYEDELQSAVGGGVALPFVVSGQRPPTRWNLTQAVFFATTVLTTIGYGNIAPETFWGRAFCMLYALVGIPLTLTVIADMGRLLASAVSALHARARRHTAGLPMPPKLPAWCRRSLTVLAAVACMLLYMAAGAGFICLWEDWSFFQGFYFCFITMTTIGFGDVVPGSGLHDAVHAVHPGGAGAHVHHHRAGAAAVRAVVAPPAGAVGAAGRVAAAPGRERGAGRQRHRRHRAAPHAHRQRAQAPPGRRQREGARRVGAGDGGCAAEDHGAAPAPARAADRHLRDHGVSGPRRARQRSSPAAARSP